MELKKENRVEIDKIVDLSFQQLIKEDVGDYIISIEDIMETLNDENEKKANDTVSFREKWQRQFSKMTKKPFYCDIENQWKDTWMMHLTSVLFTGDLTELHCRVLELPFADLTKSMYILLPNDKSGLPALEKALGADSFSKTWKRIVQRMAKHLVTVKLPKTYIKTTFRVDTNATRGKLLP